MEKETYLGDGVYASLVNNGSMIKIRTERFDAATGLPVQHYIFFEPAVFRALAEYAVKVWSLKLSD